jgi:hypothetical protein
MNNILKTILIIAAIFLGFGLVGSIFGILWVVLKYALIGAGLYVGYKVIAGSNNKKIE